MDRLKKNGFIVLRNFNVDLEHFSQFVQRLSVSVMLDPTRQFGGTFVQKVNPDINAVALHCENWNSRFMPHLCWFFCEQAATNNSQTIVCDGERVWNALSATTQQVFLSKDIAYSCNIESDKWKNFVFLSLKAQKSMEEIVIEDLINLINDPIHTIIEANQDGSVNYVFRLPAAHNTLFSDRIAFANSILIPSEQCNQANITLVGGEEISPSIMEEILQVTTAMTETIEWQDGDVLIIDNTRVMHGYRPIIDPNQKLYKALSYIK